MLIEIKDNLFQLLPHKAILWQNTKTLLIADLHLGKVTHFRKEGIAVPAASIHNNFARLDDMINNHEVQRIIFLGDLFHNRYNAEWDLFMDWRMKYSQIEMCIVPGNHDVLPQIHFDHGMIKVLDDFYREGNFMFTHHPFPTPPDDVFTFCGHVHPIFTLHAKGLQRIKLHCFVFDALQAILPSFGVFTGGFRMQKISERNIYVVADDKIIAIHQDKE